MANIGIQAWANKRYNLEVGLYWAFQEWCRNWPGTLPESSSLHPHRNVCSPSCLEFHVAVTCQAQRTFVFIGLCLADLKPTKEKELKATYSFFELHRYSDQPSDITSNRITIAMMATMNIYKQQDHHCNSDRKEEQTRQAAGLQLTEQRGSGKQQCPINSVRHHTADKCDNPTNKPDICDKSSTAWG